MIIYVPFTHVAPGVREAIAAASWAWRELDVSGSDTAYWEFFAVTWSARETFCVVEHDIVTPPGALDELANCPSDWCGFVVPYLNAEYPGLGCCKFSKSLLAELPGVVEEAGQISMFGHPKRHWCTLDGTLRQTLDNYGVTQCLHRHADMGHWRPYSSLPPAPTHNCHPEITPPEDSIPAVHMLA